MKKKTVYFCIFLLVLSILVFCGLFLSPARGRCGGKDARPQADMAQMRTLAEIYYSEKNGYANFDCDSLEQTRILCKDIVAQGYTRPVFKSAINEYCGYTQGEKMQKYICINHKGKMYQTYINPAKESFCDGKTFNCPDEIGTPPPYSPSFYKVIKERFFTALPGCLLLIFVVLSLLEFIFGIILMIRPGKINKTMGLIMLLSTLLLFYLLFFIVQPFTNRIC